ncbi:MAG: hypothetical protein LBF44_02625 [Holosporaceae bacterium]|jgi:chromosome segregation ATPase|nr:hypothetical protein [Holosporaceae bacterium]
MNLYGIKAESEILAIPGALSPQSLKKLVKTNGALNTYALIAAEVETNLNKMKEDIDWINDLVDEIKRKLQNKQETQNDIKNLDEKKENLNKIYKECYKELKHEPAPNCSILVNCLKDLKELQVNIQDLRNIINAIIDKLRQLLSKQGQPLSQQGQLSLTDLHTSKTEGKLTNVHNDSLDRITNHIINNIIVPASEAYSEISYEERNRGLYTTSSPRSL